MPKHNSFRSLEDFEQQLTKKEAGTARVLGLDLGTNCGIAIADVTPQSSKPVLMFAGQWDLSLNDWDSGPLRHLRLTALLHCAQPDAIGFEDVKFTPDASMAGKPIAVILARSSKAAEFLGSLKTTVASWAESRRVPAQGFGISELKKYATGKGNSGKVAMVKACNDRLDAQFTLDEEEILSQGIDNVADACWACAMMIDANYPGLFSLPALVGK